MNDYEGMSRKQLIDTIHGKESEVQRLQGELNALAGKPMKFAIRELREEVSRQMNIAKHRAKKFDDLKNELQSKSPNVQRVLDDLCEEVQKNTKIEEHRVEQQDYIIKIKKQNKELQQEKARLEERCKNEVGRRKEIASKLVEARSQDDSKNRVMAIYPSEDEIRAAYKLGVDIKTLRAWVTAGIGPQPPYNDLDSWQGWVQAWSEDD